MQKLSLKGIHSDYRDPRDIHTALAWNAVKKILEEHHRDDLFEVIRSIRLSEKYIIITTGSPIVNAELAFYAEDILARFHESLKTFGGVPRRAIRMR